MNYTLIVVGIVHSNWIILLPGIFLGLYIYNMAKLIKTFVKSPGHWCDGSMVPWLEFFVLDIFGGNISLIYFLREEMKRLYQIDIVPWNVIEVLLDILSVYLSSFIKIDSLTLNSTTKQKKKQMMSIIYKIWWGVLGIVR